MTSMKRIISPPREDWDKLRQKLEAGEVLFVDYLDANLDVGWEIYIQPHLNGLCPDVIILHPERGICIFEVKNWDFDAIKYTVVQKNNGKLHLEGEKKSTNEKFSRVKGNPVDQLLLYRKELRHLYCPQLDTELGSKVLFCGLVFPSATYSQIEGNIIPIFKNRGRVIFDSENQNAKYFVFTKENFDKNLKESFPDGLSNNRKSRIMNEIIAEYLRFWVREPDSSKVQREPLKYEKAKEEFIFNRTKSGYRRLKGAAGSGKSIVLALRAAQLLQADKKVLVVSFNITLLNYLADLTVRAYARARHEAIWLNFHYLCSRICIDAGFEKEYNDLFKNKSEDEFIDNSELCDLVELVLYRDTDIEKYDAILVDEGQDFQPRWWSILRKLVVENGEMLLVADSTQDVYGSASLWTDEVMKNSGFSGAWATLENTYRLPPSLAPLVEDFAKRFLPAESVIAPKSPQLDLLSSDAEVACQLRWIQIPKIDSTSINDVIKKFRSDMMLLQLSNSDQTILVSNNSLGMQVCKEMKKFAEVIEIFSDSWRESQRKKKYFFKGSEKVKVCTIHSFKGWEAKAILIIVDKLQSKKDYVLLYTALTRLKGDSNCLMYVVCADSNLDSYGKTWSSSYSLGESLT